MDRRKRRPALRDGWRTHRAEAPEIASPRRRASAPYTTRAARPRRPAPGVQRPRSMERPSRSPDGPQLTAKADLPNTASAFPTQRKEPMTDAKHVRNAAARFDQVTDVSDEDR